MPRLLLVRHASTLRPDTPRMSGWTDLPLTDEGRRQVEALASWMLKEAPLDRVYSSPLQRARETAQALRSRVAVDIVYDDALREIHCGEVDGRPIREVEAERPELWAANLAQNDDDFRWPGGESYREFRERCVRAVRRIAASGGSRIALVTHSGFINQVVGSLSGIGLSPARWEPFRPGNASITEIDWSGDDGVLVAFDRRAGRPGSSPDASIAEA